MRVRLPSGAGASEDEDNDGDTNDEFGGSENMSSKKDSGDSFLTAACDGGGRASETVAAVAAPVSPWFDCADCAETLPLPLPLAMVVPMSVTEAGTDSGIDSEAETDAVAEAEAEAEAISDSAAETVTGAVADSERGSERGAATETDSGTDASSESAVAFSAFAFARSTKAMRRRGAVVSASTAPGEAADVAAVPVLALALEFVTPESDLAVRVETRSRRLPVGECGCGCDARLA